MKRCVNLKWLAAWSRTIWNTDKHINICSTADRPIVLPDTVPVVWIVPGAAICFATRFCAALAVRRAPVAADIMTRGNGGD